jgi:succinoglycan biosynthesis protein ExoW
MTRTANGVVTTLQSPGLYTDDPAVKPRITVIIPYFQKRSGILRNTIAFAASQKNAPVYEIIVIDDGSPIPASEELADLCASGTVRLRVLRQPNGGPGAARNTGIEHAAPATEYIAFLDSDDSWREDHLARAARALDAGFDFYFSNFTYLHNKDGFLDVKRFTLEAHPPLSEGSNLFRVGPGFFDLLLSRNPVGTSTVVYRLAAAPDARFDPRFFNGQDELFWLGLASRTSRIVVSNEQEATYGFGVNISVPTFGSYESLRLILRLLRYNRALPQLFDLNPTQKRVIHTRIRRLELDFVQNIASRLSHSHRVEFGLILEFIRHRPVRLFIIFRILFERLRGKSIGI